MHKGASALRDLVLIAAARDRRDLEWNVRFAQFANTCRSREASRRADLSRSHRSAPFVCGWSCVDLPPRTGFRAERTGLRLHEARRIASCEQPLVGHRPTLRVLSAAYFFVSCPITTVSSSTATPNPISSKISTQVTRPPRLQLQGTRLPPQMTVSDASQTIVVRPHWITRSCAPTDRAPAALGGVGLCGIGVGGVVA